MRDLFQRLDPRTRILAVVAAIVIIGSTARLAVFPWYFALAAAMIAASRARGGEIRWRVLAAAPFILLASALLAFQAGIAAGSVVAMKGMLAAALLALLASTTPLADLLWALRRMKSPESLNLILGMMHRYTTLLAEEYARMARARDSRSVQTIGRLGFLAHGGQIGALVLRSWDRAERIHASMLARGFTGAWPSLTARRLGAIDGIYLAAAVALFLAARLAA